MAEQETDRRDSGGCVVMKSLDRAQGVVEQQYGHDGCGGLRLSGMGSTCLSEDKELRKPSLILGRLEVKEAALVVGRGRTDARSGLDSKVRPCWC